MCVVSMVMDHYQDTWRQRTQPVLYEVIPAVTPVVIMPNPPVVPSVPLVTKEEVEEFRRLLERAREYDRRNGEPDCELDEKRQALKRLAEELGVEIAFL